MKREVAAKIQPILCGILIENYFYVFIIVSRSVIVFENNK
jgi:hypothetical protein